MLLNRKFIYIMLGLQFIGIILTLLFSNTISADNIEHLRMSFLVSEGYVPYRDFFEHHHPLMWYIFAPIIKVLPQNAILLFYVSRILSLSASGALFYIIYRLFREFLGNRKQFIYFLAVVFSFFPLWYGVCIFKPDTFMRLFYFAGLYLFFRYIRDEKTKDLMYCGICFTVAFLFLQTIAFSILPLALPLGYVLYKKPSAVKQLALAAIPSLLLIGATIFALIISGTWQAYFDLNWLLNKHVSGLFSLDKSSAVWNFLPLFVAAATIFILMYKKQNTSLYLNIIALLFVGEFIQHCIFLALFPHYLINLLIFSALIIAVYLPQITNKTAINYLYAFFIAFFILNILALTSHPIKDTLKALKLLNNHQNATLLHIDYFTDQIYVPLRSYHTLGDDTLNLYNKLFNKAYPFDFVTYLSRNNIKYIDFKLAQTNRGKTLTDFILNNYEPLTDNLWQLRENTEK
ncbi:MAG: glycosyltransferase family 39 protein [Alphaproteobacteria bacterium]|nr:glycosyltransferase family 39 protein [Alphaproteobacteria bacterium]